MALIFLPCLTAQQDVPRIPRSLGERWQEEDVPLERASADALNGSFYSTVDTLSRAHPCENKVVVYLSFDSAQLV
jgi:hypothetical protein